MNSSNPYKPKLLVVLSRFPYPLDKGDKLRAYYQLKELSNTNEITLVALTDKEITEAHKAAVQEICSTLVICKLNWFSKAYNMLRAFLAQRPLQTGYFYRYSAQRKINQLIEAQQFDHIYAQLVRTAEYVKNVHTIPKTLDYMDALSAGVMRRIDQQSILKRWIFRLEYKRLIRYEQLAFDHFEHCTIISEQDRKLIHHPENYKIKCIPNGIDRSFFAYTDYPKSYDFVFVGNMSYPPNVEAVQYIAESILPKIKDATLLISGASPHATVASLVKNNERISMTGWVDDIRASYADGKIFLAPMMIGTGMQNKLLEAMAMGIPCVTTPLANNAIKATDKQEIMVAESLEDMLAAIHALMNDEILYDSISKNARQFVEKNYSWKQSTEELQSLMFEGK